MELSLFKRKILETKLFEENKDKAIISSRHLRDTNIKYDGLVIWRDLYAKIINYQVKKYGGQLSDPKTLNLFYLMSQKQNSKKW